jgi:hypothetical protein
MIIGALITMAFFFAYTQVRDNAQNLAFTCCISFFLVSFLGWLVGGGQGERSVNEMLTVKLEYLLCYFVCLYA